MATRIDQEYQDLKKRVHYYIVERLDEEGIEVGKTGRETLQAFVQNSVQGFVSQHRMPLSAQDLALLSRETFDEVVGFGPLEPLLADDSVNDIRSCGGK